MEDHILDIIIECVKKMYDIPESFITNDNQKIPGQIVFDELEKSGYKIVLKGFNDV